MNQRYLILTTPHYAGQVKGKTKNLCMAVMLQLQCAVCVVSTVIITRCHLSKSQGIISFYKFMEAFFLYSILVLERKYSKCYEEYV